MSYDDELLAAPCKWCGYNGPGYWKAETHSKECPWHEVGGESERKEMLTEVLFKPTNKQG